MTNITKTLTLVVAVLSFAALSACGDGPKEVEVMTKPVVTKDPVSSKL